MAAITAEIVTTGTEILLGDIVDTNAAWIAQQLREAGVNLYFKTTVGDNLARIRSVLELSMTRCDVIIVTGGLGPTVDDVTRHAIAEATAHPLQLHEGALATLQARFARFGSQMTENNKQQALIPVGAILIENPVGTAPGFIVETERCAVVALPGVPREMKQLMQDTVLPYLRQKAGEGGIIRRRILRTFGIGESTIDHLLDAMMRQANPTVGLAAHTGQVDVRIAARAETAEQAEALLDAAEAQVRAAIGQYVYTTTPGEAFEGVVAQELRNANARVALFETNTQGALAGRLAAAGAADENADLVAKTAVLGRDALDSGLETLVSAALSDSERREQAAVAATQWLLGESEKGPRVVAVALVGTSGPDEGVFGKQPGETWLAVNDGLHIVTERIGFGGADDYTTVRIGNQALAALRKFVA